jgi:hypothetical protein
MSAPERLSATMRNSANFAPRSAKVAHRLKQRDGHQSRSLSHLWTALPLQVDVEKDPLWFVANIYPASPDGIGAPKRGIRSRTPLQLVGLEGLDKSQALCAPVRPMRLISPSSRKLWAGLQKAARYGSPVRSTAQMMRAFLLATATVARLNPRGSRSWLTHWS